MKEFGYQRADDVTGAVALLAADPQARFLGGGTNLVDLMKSGVERPALLVDVRELPWTASRPRPTAVCASGRPSPTAISPPTPKSAATTRRWPRPCWPEPPDNCATWPPSAAISSSAPAAATSPTSPSPATSGPRAAVAPPSAGEHHNHAVLGASGHCVAVHPSDMGVALTAFDAVVSYESADGPGRSPITDFYLPVGDTPHRETALPPGALITHVSLPAAPVAAHSRYRKVRERASYAFAIGSVAAALDIEDGLIREARLALGAVASRPWRARAAEAVLTGAADGATFAAAADAELAAARPLPDNGYKVTLMRNLVVSVLTELAGSDAR